MTRGVEIGSSVKAFEPGSLLPGFYAKIGGHEVQVVKTPLDAEPRLVFADTGTEVPGLDALHRKELKKPIIHRGVAETGLKQTVESQHLAA